MYDSLLRTEEHAKATIPSYKLLQHLLPLLQTDMYKHKTNSSSLYSSINQINPLDDSLADVIVATIVKVQYS